MGRRRRWAAGARQLVADRDRRDHDHQPPRRTSGRARWAGRCPASTRRCWRRGEDGRAALRRRPFGRRARRRGAKASSRCGRAGRRCSAATCTTTARYAEVLRGRLVPHRRPRPPRRGRLLLVRRARRRRHQVRGPPDRALRGRERADGAPGRRRGRRDRQAGPGRRRARQGVRHAAPRLRADRRAAHATAGLRPHAAGLRSRRRRSSSTRPCRTPAAARSCAGCSRRASSGCPRATCRPWRRRHDHDPTAAMADGPDEQASGLALLHRHAAHPPLRGAVRRAVQRRQDPRLPAPVHRRGGRGHRACMPALDPTTPSSSTYREHGHALARGVPGTRVMAEMFGRSTGCSRGRGGSMHLFDAARRFYGGNADRRRRAPARGRARARRPDARPRPGDRLLLRRRRRRRGRVPRVAQPGRAVAAAGAVLLREQPLRDGHRAGARRRRRPTSRCAPPRTGWPSWSVDGMDVEAVEDGGPARRSTRSAPAAGRASWSCAPTASAPTRCTTRTATGTRPRSRVAASGTRSTLLAAALRADGELDDAALAAMERRGRRRDRRRRSTSPRRAARAGRGPDPVRLQRRRSWTRHRSGLKTTYREAMREALREALRARRPRLPHGRGRRPLRRLLRRQPRAARGVRPRADPRHAAVGVGVRRRRASAPRSAGCGPIVEIMTVNFSLLALDQILNNAATLLHMSGGQFSVPLVIRMTTGAGPPARRPALAQPGGLVRPHPRPARPRARDDRGRPRHARPGARRPRPGADLRARRPLQREPASSPGDAGPVDIDRAAVRRPGTDVTLIAYGGTLGKALAAAEELAGRGHRGRGRSTCGRCGRWTTRPSWSRCAHPPRRRGRRGVAHRQPRRRGRGAHHRAGFYDLDAPVERVCSAEVPIPYAKHLEEAALPQVADDRRRRAPDGWLSRWPSSACPSLGADMDDGHGARVAGRARRHVHKGDIVAVVDTAKADDRGRVLRRPASCDELLVPVGRRCRSARRSRYRGGGCDRALRPPAGPRSGPPPRQAPPVVRRRTRTSPLARKQAAQGRDLATVHRQRAGRRDHPQRRRAHRSRPAAGTGCGCRPDARSSPRPAASISPRSIATGSDGAVRAADLPRRTPHRGPRAARPDALGHRPR